MYSIAEPSYETLDIKGGKYRVNCIADQFLQNLDPKRGKQIDDKKKKQKEWVNAYQYDSEDDKEECKLGELPKLQKKPSIVDPELEQEPSDVAKSIKEHTHTKSIYQVQDQKFTHFISIPLNYQPVLQELDNLKKQIAGIQNAKFFQQALQPSPHVTILMLQLNTEQKQKQAIKAFQDIQQQIVSIVNSHEEYFTIRDIDFFGHSKVQCRTVHYKLPQDMVNLVQEITDLCVKHFLNSKIIDLQDLSHIGYDEGREYYYLKKPHVTLFKAKKMEAQFDCTPIFEQVYGGGNRRKLFIDQIKIKTLDISTRGKFDDTGFYMPLCRLDI